MLATTRRRPRHPPSVRGGAVAHTRARPPPLCPQGDPITLKVNKLMSVKNLPYQYYSLPYCRPAKIVSSAENLGEVLRGDRIENSPYDVRQRCALWRWVLHCRGWVVASSQQRTQSAVSGCRGIARGGAAALFQPPPPGAAGRRPCRPRSARTSSAALCAASRR